MNTPECENTYLINELAELADISLRTLRYYDHIDLLKPSWRDENGYRHYSYRDLLTLQRILFFKEFDVPLTDLKRFLHDPEVNSLDLLREHALNLKNRIRRLNTHQTTVIKTIQNMSEEKTMPLTDAELYEGYSKEKIDRYNQEVRQIYGLQIVDQVDRKVRNMSKPQWEAVKQEGSEIAQNLAALMDHDPQDSEVQVWIDRQHAWIENFYPAPADIFRGLGEMYANHPEFQAFYNQYAEGLADFMQKAMEYYAHQNLTSR